MGLTVYYDWKVKMDPRAARRAIQQYRKFALALPFDDVSEIFEKNAPDGESEFKPYDHPSREGNLLLSRTREDGENELVDVPPLHAVFFHANIEGAETVSIGLASHPPVVIHHEDVITRDENGITEHRLGGGDPVEFPTRRRGYYSWHSFCKTQYAGNPKLGGEANFLRAHLSLIELLDQIKATGVAVRIRDDSRYAQHRNVDRLLKSLRDWNGIIATFVGRLTDAIGDKGGQLLAPIRERPDFEHLEAKGIDVLKKMAARQRRRKGKQTKKPRGK